MKGRKYIYQFTADQIILVPTVDEVHGVTITPYPDEDYSIFDFGPEICKQVQVGAESCTISDVGTFENLRVTVLQPNPGNNIEIIIKDLNNRVIIDITDLIYSYNRGYDHKSNTGETIIV
jgi:hypothetical protein